MSTLVCWNCGTELNDVPLPISRHATCSHCFNELHCCRLCRHYDSERNSQCFEDRADPPLQKNNANFCDFFSPRKDAYQPATGQTKNTAIDELEALFDQSSGNSIESDNPSSDDIDATETPLTQDAIARRKLDDLFGD